jgi:hypothetical protein
MPGSLRRGSDPLHAPSPLSPLMTLPRPSVHGTLIHGGLTQVDRNQNKLQLTATAKMIEGT